MKNKLALRDFFPRNSEWFSYCEDEFEKDYFLNIQSYLSERIAQGSSVFPPIEQIFKAFELSPFTKTKVVIIGQDPYHGKGQAHGLLFSVPNGIRLPPSLRNIFKELYNDMGIEPAQNGNLESWARQGVLLLNTILTVEEGRPSAHQGIGWEIFTDHVIHILNSYRKNLVFVLWGNYAKSKKKLIESSRHLILESNHPSPLAAHRGFFGNNHFSQINIYLERNDLDPIDWIVP